MLIKKTSALVDASVLSALAVLFTLAGEFLPIVGVVADLFWPLPIILCGKRHGMKWSGLCLLVTGVLITLFLGPLVAFSVVVLLGMIGFVMGEGMRRRWTPEKIVFYGSLAAVVATLLSLAVSYVVLNIDVVGRMRAALDKGALEYQRVYIEQLQSMGMSLLQIQQGKEQMEFLLRMMKILIPLSFFVYAPIIAVLNYWGARRVLSRLGEYYPGLEPFARWQLPKTALLPYIISLALLYLKQDQQEHILYALGYNIFVLFDIMLCIEAISVLYWFIMMKRRTRILFYAAIFLILMNPLFSQLAMIVGAYDILFDFRKLRVKPTRIER